MNTTLRLTIIAFLVVIFFSCKKSNSAPAPVVIDTNAFAFIDSAGITDTVQKIAINNLVLDLKKSSLWTEFRAIYPMIGGTANSMKWNLMNPQNSDLAYRLTFYGSPIFSSTGILFPTTSDYADTHQNDSLLPYNNNSISYYSNTQNSQDGFDMGCSDTSRPYNTFSVYNSRDSSVWFGLLAYTTTPAVTKGMFTNSATSTDVKRYENGVITNTKNKPPTIYFTNLNIRIGAIQGASYMGQRECGLAAIGSGLTNAQAATFSNIVRKYENSLGRY